MLAVPEQAQSTIMAGNNTSLTPVPQIVSSSSTPRPSMARGSDSSFSETGDGRFYTLQTLTTTVGGSSSITAVIAATVSFLGGLVVVVGLIVVYLCHRKNKVSDIEVMELNAPYHSGSHDVAVDHDLSSCAV